MGDAPVGRDRERPAQPKAVVSWSSGKDAAYALWTARRDGAVEIVGLLTTVTREFARVSMHGVREELLDRQAAALGLPVKKVGIPSPCPNEVYERAMAAAVAEFEREGVQKVLFGDLFLEDVRTYRESRLAQTGVRSLFPLWGRDTAQLAREMIASGLEAYVCCLDPRRLPRSFGGRTFDTSFLRDLPESVDPCGENGEFHTFVAGGPMFSRPVPVGIGKTVERDGFVFTDLVPR
ncbi:MAG TPA: ATP-binding protein [Thermoplasmata archaeon]|nr:ATP-binding protein [Thermoplasmata archaeon]